MYQRSASAPYSPRVENGSTALPSLLLILFPSLSSTSPLESTVLNATLSLTIVEIAWRVKNHPRVWSTPSAIKSAVRPNAGEPALPSPSCAKGIAPESNQTSIRSVSRFIGFPEGETRIKPSTYGLWRSIFS